MTRAGPARALRTAPLVVVDVTSFFSASASGGIRTYLAEKAKALGRLGVRHVVVVPGEVSDAGVWEGSELHRVRSPELPFAPAYRQMVDWRGVAEVIGRVRPSVVEVGSPFTVPLLVRRALAGRRIPTVGFYHSDLVRTYAEPYVDHAVLGALRVGLRMTARRLIRSIYNGFDATACASPSLVRELQALGVRQVREVPLGVDLDLFRPLPPSPPRRPPDAPPVALYVGRLCTEKRLDVVLDGHRRIPEDQRPELVLVGDGNIRHQILARAREQARVTVRPYVSDRKALVRLFNEADYYVAPGPGETFGLAIGEALACGLPVLCVARGAGPDRIAGSGVGALYRHGDPDDVARAMASMPALLGPEARRRARAHAERTLSWSATFDRLVSLYGSLVRSPEAGWVA